MKFLPLLLLTTLCAHAGPDPRCRQFLTPNYGNQPLILGQEAYDHIRAHPIMKFAQQLHKRKIRLSFEDLSFSSDGYGMQRAMLGVVLPEVFPEAIFNLGDNPSPDSDAIKIKIDLRDTPLHEGIFSLRFDPDWEDESILQMARVKSANPLLVPLSKQGMREALKIPKNLTVASVYMDTTEEGALVRIFSKIKPKPDLVFLSFSWSTNLGKEKIIPGYQVLSLSSRAMEEPHALDQPTIVFNDQKLRMMELYAASDYAIVIGPNNIFEPLRAHCPTLFFRRPWPYFSIFEGLAGPVATYHSLEWNKLATLAEATGGGFGITSTWQVPEVMKKIRALNPDAITNPAFTSYDKNSPVPFDRMLSDIENMIRNKLRAEGIILFR